MGSLIACARAACTLFAVVAVLAAPRVACAHGDHEHDRGQKNKIDVRGTVSAIDGSPIAGASIVLSSQVFAKRAHSDAHGKFKFDDIQPGTYSVQGSAPGYQTLSQRTVTLDATNKTLALVLSPATTNSLTVIGQVRASAGETVSTSSAPTVSLNAQTAAAAGATSVSSMVWNQLSTTPVLPLGGGSNATVVYAVRGPDPTETLVDIDGHQVNNGNTGDLDLSLLDPAALQDVQVVYGISPSSLIGPNTIGGGLNIVTLQPTATPHSLLRIFGGSYGTFGETLQTTGTDDRLGYAVSLHNATSSGSVNQTILAPTPQNVGSYSNADSILTKLRYQLGGPNGYGYVQLNFRDQTVVKDDSALLTTYTPPGFAGGGGGGGDAAPADSAAASGSYQSFAGTLLGAHQANYGLDAQLPLGNQSVGGAPATVAQFSHLTTLSSQSVSGPGEASLPYLYNQRDLLGDDWLEVDHHFSSSLLSFKYDIGTETLVTNYVQGQVVAQAKPVGAGQTPPTQVVSLAQTQRSSVLRYEADPTSHIHYSLALYDSDFSTFGTSFDPRAGFVWTPTGNTAVRASVGTTFQTPQLTELVVPPPADRVPVGGIIFIGNPNLRPDRATDFDLGAEHIVTLGRHPLHLAMDLYQTNLRTPSSSAERHADSQLSDEAEPDAVPAELPGQCGQRHLSRRRSARRPAGWPRPARSRRLGRGQLVPDRDSSLDSRRHARRGSADSRPAAAQGVRRDRSRAADGPRLRRAPRLRGRV